MPNRPSFALPLVVRGRLFRPSILTEIRYFLTSCDDDPAVLGRAIRRHWSIKNTLHWVLNVTFREDDSRVRHRTADRNLALLRKIALNLVAGGSGAGGFAAITNSNDLPTMFRSCDYPSRKSQSQIPFGQLDQLPAQLAAFFG